MIILSTPVGTLFPLALLSVLGGTLLIGIISSKRKLKEKQEKKDQAYREMLQRNRFKPRNKKQ